MSYDPSSLTPGSAVVGNGETIVYGRTGLEIAKWKRELTPAELTSYMEFPGQIFAPPKPKAHPAFGRTTPPRLVTHADGGQYVHIGTAHGAGKSRGAPPVEVYRSIEDGRLWFRDPDDFADRMTP